MKDSLYSKKEVTGGSFKFDGTVVEVFQDMIQRSVPGYGLTLEMIGVVAQRAFSGAADDAVSYDLGCSLGASMFPVLEKTGAHVVGVDLSSEMLQQAEDNLKMHFPDRYTLQKEDLRAFTFTRSARFICVNFTLQFLPVDERVSLLEKCYAALQDGGILLISEKFKAENEVDDTLLTDLHHTFKGAMGYSALEIARKRDAIENVLIPETKEAHLVRLSEAGFQNPVCWYQCFNFASFIAVKA